MKRCNIITTQVKKKIKKLVKIIKLPLLLELNLGARLLGNKLIGKLFLTDDLVLRFWTEKFF
jgi:hypothetical protein